MKYFLLFLLAVISSQLTFSQNINGTSYPFSVSTGITPEDMSTGTTQAIAANNDGSNASTIPIGFDFWFLGVRRTSIYVNTNGIARLAGAVSGTDSLEYFNQTDTSAQSVSLMPYWDNIRTGAVTGKVHYKREGASPNQRLIIEWFDMQVPQANAGDPGTATFQLVIYETTGLIEFNYVTGLVLNNVHQGYTVGIKNTKGDFGSVTVASPVTSSSISYVTANDANTIAIPNNTRFTFTPEIPNAPTGLNFTNINAATYTLNWTDNATNETGYAIYRSNDGGATYTYMTRTAANVATYPAIGLYATTNYTWKVIAVSQGGESSPLTGSQTTNAASIKTSVASGNWSTGATWSGGTVPTASDQVVIANGHTVTMNTTAAAYSLTVGQGTSGILEYNPTTARSLTVETDVEIRNGAQLLAPSTGSIVTHNLILGRSLINNGILDLSTNGNTAGVVLQFNDSLEAVYSGTGTNDLYRMTVNKGSSVNGNNCMVEMNVSNFSVQGFTTDNPATSFLTMTRGTLKISGTNTFAGRFFIPVRSGTTGINSYSLTSSTGFWLNNPNITVTPQPARAAIAGYFRLSQGVFNVGDSLENQLSFGADTVLIEGGTLNVASAIKSSSATPYIQTGGTVNVNTIGHTSTGAVFEFTSASAEMNFDGGNIIIHNSNLHVTGLDCRIIAPPASNNTNFVFGSASTLLPNDTFVVRDRLTSFTIDNTGSNKMMRIYGGTAYLDGVATIPAGSTFNLAGRALVLVNDQIINNGEIDGRNADGSQNTSSRFTARGTSAQSLTGTGTYGTNTNPLPFFDIDNLSGVNLSQANPLITNRVCLINGSLTNTGNMVVGTGGTSSAMAQIGNTTTPSSPGTFDVTPTYNPGTGGILLGYYRVNSTATVGAANEVPAGNTIYRLILDDNVNKLLHLNQNLIITSTTTLSNGVLNIGANTLTMASSVTNSAVNNLRGGSNSHLVITGSGNLSSLYFDQTTDGSTNTLNSLTINKSSGTVTLNAATKLGIRNVLTVNSGILNANGALHILSSSTGTARIAQSAGTISGNVTVERWVNGASTWNRRRWHLLTLPVGTTINAGWQESGVNNNGYGTFITDPANAGGTNGFDAAAGLASASIREFTSNGTVLSTPANTTTTVAAGNAYFLFLRGNRTVLPTPTGTGYSNATLRGTGTIRQGTVTLTGAMPATGFAVIGNPYASPVNFSALTISGGNGFTGFKLWDPAIGGTGGYVDFNNDGTIAAGTSPSYGAATAIQSGQAFMVSSTGVAGNIVFTEASKTTIGDNVLRNGSTLPKLDIWFNKRDASNNFIYTDGTAAYFDNAFSNNLALNEDVHKAWNNGENFCLIKNTKYLSVERLKLPVVNDSLFLIQSVSNGTYKLEIHAENMDALLPAYLIDSYLNTETPINMSGVTEYQYTATNAAASKAYSRFTIVFKQASMPVTFSGIKAYKKAEGINVEWNVAQEKDIEKYEIERSANGVEFSVIGNAAPKNIGNTTYTHFDAQPLNGDNFYRVKSIDRNGKVQFTSIVKVNMTSKEAYVSVYPNPVKDGRVNFTLSDIEKGNYNAVVYSADGKRIASKTINFAGGVASENITLPAATAKGIYQLQLTGDKTYTVQIVVE